MNLYELPANNHKSFFGPPENPTGVDAVIVAQKPDCSAFLVLSENDSLLLTKLDSIPDGYDFTYCQPWGLVVTPELLVRTERDLIARYPGRFPQTEVVHNIAAIKAKANEIILARFPEYKQRNYLKREIELQNKLITGGTLTPEEQVELNFISAEWAWVKAIRETSNAAEAAGTLVDEIVWPT